MGSLDARSARSRKMGSTSLLSSAALCPISPLALTAAVSAAERPRCARQIVRQRLHEVLASCKELEDFRIGSRSLGRGCRSSSQSAERHVKTEGEFLKLGAADVGRTVVSPGGQGVDLFHRKSGGSRTTYRTRVNVSVTEIGWCWKGADHRILLWL